MSKWYLAPSLAKLRSQVARCWPSRSTNLGPISEYTP